ncbi:MAG TPA: ribonuclease HII [bacterium]|mgnify:CR=1 FL=1|nr:ribonuclease HII [bacterium]
MSQPSFSLEQDLSATYSVIAGIDEVGRGALAGPIVAAAVVFSDYDEVIHRLSEVEDSKKIPHNKHRELADLVKKEAKVWAVGVISVAEINKFGIGAANVMAFERALSQIPNADFVLIDGRRFRGFPYKYRCVEKGESISISIAAASIVAKDFRDTLMKDLHKDFPKYGFDTNVGYGCQKHYDALKNIGPSIHHRTQFVSGIIDEPVSLF